MAGTVTGENANVWIAAHAGGASVSDYTSKDHATFAISDFSLTMDRGTVEQDLIGLPGNYFDQGKLSMEGSLTQCRFGTSGNADLLASIIDGTGNYQYVTISGQISDDGGGVTYLKWYLVSCQVTGYDFTFGDADTISEASIDFQVLDPQNITYSTGTISDA